MATVTPKLIYSKYQHGDVPVWEIITETGRKIYYERVRRPGYRAIGYNESFKSGNTTYNVCDLAIPPPGSFTRIYREKDGYVAPMYWYEKDPDYTGPEVYYDDIVGGATVESEDGSDNDEDTLY